MGLVTWNITTNWFWQNFTKEARKYCMEMGLPEDCKIILLLDKCSIHPDAESFTKNNITVLYIFPNYTSLIQPMDQGVIHSLKSNNRKEFM